MVYEIVELTRKAIFLVASVLNIDGLIEINHVLGHTLLFLHLVTLELIDEHVIEMLSLNVL
jgi:hypothetical protein